MVSTPVCESIHAQRNSASTVAQRSRRVILLSASALRFVCVLILNPCCGPPPFVPIPNIPSRARSKIPPSSDSPLATACAAAVDASGKRKRTTARLARLLLPLPTWLFCFGYMVPKDVLLAFNSFGHCRPLSRP